MATVSDFYSFLDKEAPFDAQESWDNSGLLVGDPDAEVTRAAVVLDITNEAVKSAADIGAQLIISHHPVIFRAQKSFLKGNPAYELAKSSISAICAHTSLDCADGGVNDTLAEILSVKNVEVFPCEESPSLLRAGVLEEPLSCQELAQKIKDALGGSVRYCDNGKMIESVALCGGSGCSLKDDVIKAGIDAYITGDAGYHDFLECSQQSLALFAAGHYETENPIVTVTANRLRAQFPDTDIVVITQKNPIRYI